MIVVTDSELNRPKKIIVSAKVQATFGTFCSFQSQLAFRTHQTNLQALKRLISL